jgi:hypothetical protein
MKIKEANKKKWATLAVIGIDAMQDEMHPAQNRPTWYHFG